MQTIQRKRARTATVPAKAEASVLEEMLEVSVQPDRAHHDELGRTRNGDEEPASPREQPAGPLDVSKVEE